MKTLPQPPNNVSVILASPLRQDQEALRRIFAETNWILHVAADRKSCLALARAQGIGAVISEAILPDGDWQSLLNDLHSLDVPPRLIVTSRTADDRLWLDVLSFGGYDLLAKPFERKEVIRVTFQAWQGWRADWARRYGERVRLAGGS